MCYVIKMISYMKSLTKDPPKDKKVRDETIKSIINEFATFLNIPCPECSVLLVDPIGIKLKDNMRHARCGNCGFKTVIKFL